MARLQEDNYWGKRTPSTDKQIRRPSDAASIANAPIKNEALAKLVQELAARQQANPGATPWSQPFDPIKATLDQTAFVPGTDIPRVAPAGLINSPTPVTPTPIYNGPHTLAKSANSAVGGISRGFSDIAQSIIGAVNQAVQEAANTPEAILRRLQEQAGSVDYNGPSAEEMAKRQFDPQFALLDQLAKQTDQRYQNNKQDITGMYNGLVNAQTQGRAEDQRMFSGAVDATGKNYADASSNVSSGASAYSKAMADELARLGVKEGLGDLTGKVQTNLQNNLGRLNQQGAGTKDLLTSLGANEYAYDTNQIGNAKQAGINTQEQFLQDYMDRMGQNDQQRLSLTGQQAQTANDYSMQIQKLLQDAQASRQGSITDQLQAILSGNQNQANNFYRQADLDLKQNQFAYQKQQDQYKQQSNPAANLNPYDALSQRALAQYKDPVKARQAVDEILAAYQNNPNATSVGDFLNSVDQEALRNNPEMTSLIYDFISRIIGKQ